MNFFRSVFSDDPDPPSSSAAAANDAASPPIATTTTTWSLGGLITTVATRSESVISTVRRDLEEFGSGLKKETETLTRAVADLDLPAVVSIDSIGKIAESLLVSPDRDADYSSSSDSGAVRDDGDVRVSRFERKLRVIRGDVRVYVEDPEEDPEEYGRWKLGFDLGEKREEIEGLTRDGEILGGIYRKLVVGSEGVVDHETFWCRYFYRVERLRQAEFVRARLVKRAMRDEDEDEELSWDVKDEDEEEKNVQVANASSADVDNGKMDNVVSVNADNMKGKETIASSVDADNAVTGSSSLSEVKDVGEADRSEGNGEEVDVLNEKIGSEVSEKEIIGDEKSKRSVGEVAIEEKHEHSGSSGAKDGDVVEVSKDTKQSVPDEEDLGWDEIEDVGSEDEKKVSVKPSGSHDRAELWKRQSAADEVEDLSWDIEDDDEPVKA